MRQPEPSRGYRVLVVEDEGLIAHDVSRRLESQGHQILGPASTAAEALALAPGAEIVLMDIRIDGPRDGIEAALEIRARHHLPVIFMTAYTDRSTLERAKQAAPCGFIVKPLGPASLQTGIEMAIAKHRGERLLEQRETWLRAVLASIADAAVAVDADGRVRLLNSAAEQATGWTQTEAGEQPLRKVVNLTVPEGDFDPIPLALLRGEPVGFGRHARLISRDGRELEVDGFAAPVRTGEEVLGAVLTFRDASRARWEERQLRQAHRLEAAGRLAAGAASEYSTLLGVIRKKNELVLRQFGEYSAARGALEEIHQAAVAVEEITSPAGGLRHPPGGSKPEALSVNGVLRRMAPLIEAAAGDRNQAAIRPSPGAGKVKADTAQFEAAIRSLISHACGVLAADGPDGSRGTGQLLVETARVDLPRAGYANSYVLLSVTYSAEEAELDRLFDPASTAGPSLALAQVHWLAAECGGYVSASPSPNGGSRIELLLPRLADQVLPTGQKALAAGDGSHTGTILLVEASAAVRTELHNFFERAGFNLIEAGDSQEAVALGELHEGRLNLVIANARQTAEVLRDLGSLYPSLQGLCVMEDSGPATLAADQIRRPFTERELLDKVEAVLGRASQQGAATAAAQGLTS